MNHGVNPTLDDLLAAERERTNREWLDAFAAAGLRRASSQKPDSVVTDIRRLMLIELSSRLKERSAILAKHGITGEPHPSKPVFRYDQSSHQ